MVKVIVHGCNGKMGQIIADIITEEADISVVAGVDGYLGVQNTYPVFAKIEDCNVEADVIIDFSNSQAVDGLLKYCVQKQLPVVLCTTGLDERQLSEVQAVSTKVAVLKSANMSLGINMLFKLLKEAANILVPAGFDMEIVEKHHRRKVDAPSGTALALADSLNEALNQEYTYNYDRSQERKPRAQKEIGISAVRGGTIVGEHDVIFAGEDEVITFSHTAYSRAVFAKGAVQAAKMLAYKPAGLYDMGDVVNV